MSVYPYKDGVFSEESICAPYENEDFLYGLSKLNSEMIFSFFLRKQNCQLINLRVAQVYGEGMRKDRIIPVMLKELADKNEIKVFGNGERTTNFIHISDLIKVINFFLQSSYRGCINIGKENACVEEQGKAPDQKKYLMSQESGCPSACPPLCTTRSNVGQERETSQWLSSSPSCCSGYVNSSERR